MKFVGALENIFTYNGDIGHEIVMVYNASFVDKSFYKIDFFDGVEDDGTVFKVFWKHLSDFQDGELRLVPENLLEIISNVRECT